MSRTSAAKASGASDAWREPAWTSASVFSTPSSSARLTGQWTGLKLRLIDEINPEEDSLRFYFLGSNWKGIVEHVGAKPARDLDGPLVV